ncbi:hypothetical protein KP791_000082 [Venturia canescens]|uniref:Uncharacterized protein n=1 Tax=Venturia canescens TaxID=32260 RepID=A0ACB9ZI79_9HYME|nr:hypothetical protein KP791_000082 [Venturia canescens]
MREERHPSSTIMCTSMKCAITQSGRMTTVLFTALLKNNVAPNSLPLKLAKSIKSNMFPLLSLIICVIRLDTLKSRDVIRA